MTNGGGKRGKKRARGEEDGLIGGLEGREAKKIPGEEVDVIVAALERESRLTFSLDRDCLLTYCRFAVTPLLQSTPTLDVSLVTFSIRLHLSLHLKLLPMSATAFVRPEDHGRIAQAARQVLSDALYIDSGESGTSRGWKAVVMSVLVCRMSAPRYRRVLLIASIANSRCTHFWAFASLSPAHDAIAAAAKRFALLQHGEQRGERAQAESGFRPRRQRRHGRR
jgi:hypothetical protein